MKTYVRSILAIPDKIVVLSPKWETFFRNLVKESNIIIIPNFVDYEKYRRIKNNEIHENKTKIVFMYGTSVVRKGMYEVLKSIPIIIENNISLLYLCIYSLTSIL